MDKKSLIGVFDSGLGGLTVVKEIKKLHPKTSIVYLGDTARVPYGTRSPATVQQFAIEDAKFLEAQGVAQIIIACNTASALAFEQVQAAVNIPVHEVITPAKIAAEKMGGKIGVIGTTATISSNAYGHSGIACPLLVPFIEAGEIDSPALEIVLRDYLKKFKNLDVLILGCTHYPFIAVKIQKIMGDKVRLVNPAEELAKALDFPDGDGNDKYYVTDLTPSFLSQDLNGKIELVHL